MLASENTSNKETITKLFMQLLWMHSIKLVHKEREIAGWPRMRLYIPLSVLFVAPFPTSSFSLSFSLIPFFTELALLVVWHCEQWEDWNSFYPSWHILFQSFHMDLLWASSSEWSFQHFLQIFGWGAACICSRTPDLLVEGPSVYKTLIWGHRFNAVLYNTHI